MVKITPIRRPPPPVRDGLSAPSNSPKTPRTPNQQQLPPLSPLSPLYTPEKYVWAFSGELKKLAKDELREDESSREQALAQMRAWIRKTSYIRDCRLDANFLLRFLRVKKFSVPMAQETLVKYIVMRQTHPAWFHHTTFADPMVMDLIDRGVAFALPGRDKFGRRVTFTIGGNIDPKYHTSEAVMKAIMLTFELLLEDEENQIRGFSHILDESGITLPHLVLWNPSEISKIFVACEKSMPMRHKSLDFIRLPPLLNYVYEFATKTFMSHKLQSRIKLHQSSKDMSRSIDAKVLPKEYGGEMPLADMIQLYKDEIRMRGDGRVVALDQMSVDVEAMKKSSGSGGYGTPGGIFAKDAMGVNGSFKKFEID